MFVWGKLSIWLEAKMMTTMTLPELGMIGKGWLYSPFHTQANIFNSIQKSSIFIGL
jgi:hypothetical protein